MLKITSLCLISLLAFGAMAQITTPAGSPSGSVSSTVGLTEVSIDYYRPKVKGRQIFGLGDQYLLQNGIMWRTGANSGTRLTVSTPAKIGGVEVPAGTYLIITTPGEDQFEFMLYSDASIGSDFSKIVEEKIKVVLKTNVIKSTEITETLTFQISDISADNTSANIHFQWSNISWKVPIEVNFDKLVMEQIAINTQVNPANYMAAANYYLETGKDLNQALEWAKSYLSIEANQNQYWNYHSLAKIQAALGMKKDAITNAEISLEAAKKGFGDAAYIKRNENLIEELKGK